MSIKESDLVDKPIGDHLTYLTGENIEFVGITEVKEGAHIISIAFIVDGKEEVRFMQPDSLWVAINDWAKNRTRCAKN